MNSAMGLDFSKNLSYFTIPAVYVATCLGPHTYAVACSGKAYDNANPRALRESVCKSEAIDKPLQQAILRAKGASENGFESMALFAGAVVAANQVGLHACVVNTLSIGYFVSRLLYVFAYVKLGENRKLAGLRSLMWMVSVGLCMTLWFKAGLKAMQ
ncbi:membrane associated eicosanoid/glutathione metabolism-like domain-containing protein [Pochonia chlamydosporia 170]|uniref:Membrane associated eicosanoid/glutathione metabolism-like domain-containing protein n=1 Tax=Pochonia chlamydosporia 170 TaxID=1380566 RepID=A0A179FXU0_METCM|nr:membrane associated eicosanoid/glutathione metabolism-like domain-containing protein [Pochonia chlamydosporia 170]OAQ70496.1 membrane associated eicosanoid/glutathione metabolism-like domain-containing protein [Pochonia chlamydosporia 170]